MTTGSSRRRPFFKDNKHFTITIIDTNGIIILMVNNITFIEFVIIGKLGIKIIPPLGN
jgi:hypothetical protein